MQFDAVFIVGVGGTGSHLIGPLVQLMEHHPDGCTNIVVIDGDSYEDKNADRQVFASDQLGKNKAVATVERLKHPALQAVAAYVDEASFTKVLAAHVPDCDDNILVITSVDNHATRKAIIDSLDNAKYQNFFLVSPGNQFSTGQITTYIKQNGVVVGVHPYQVYSDLKNPDDFIPGTVAGCEVLLRSTPQLILANMAAAWSVLSNVYLLLEDKGWFNEIHFDCVRGFIKPQGKMRNLMVELAKVEETIAT